MTNTEPCHSCGKPVAIDKRHWIVEVHDCGQSLGWFAVGPECRRQFPNAEQASALP